MPLKQLDTAEEIAQDVPHIMGQIAHLCGGTVSKTFVKHALAMPNIIVLAN